MKRWIVRGVQGDVHAMQAETGLPSLPVKLMAVRGIPVEEMKDFYDGEGPALHDPMFLSGMRTACALLDEAMRAGTKVRIMADYDADGVCAAAILHRALTDLSVSVDVVVPHRIRDGYGMQVRMADAAAEDGIGLIITCDNGIAAHEAVAAAKAHGIHVIVTDHHQVPRDETGAEYLPPADVVIDPHQTACRYPFPEICGAYVAYQLMEGLHRYLERPMLQREDLRMLAGLATVCDVMPLVNENRRLTMHAVRQFGISELPGIVALRAVFNLQPDGIDAATFGFKIGPTLNSAGRLADATVAVQLLTETDRNICNVLAQELYELNAERKRLTEAAQTVAEHLIETTDRSGDDVLVLHLPDVHESLAGIVAGRLKERYYRPVLVFTDGAEGLKGSGRSIEDYNLFEALTAVGHLFTRYGGHAAAAGFSAEPERLSAIRTAINEGAGLTEEQKMPKLMIDQPMRFSYWNEETVQEVERLAPFGTGNAEPVFAVKNVRIVSKRRMGRDGQFLKMRVDDGTAILEAVCFRETEMLTPFLAGDRPVDIAYTVS
ncbi:MAG: single-stranded-DNA-specific exonuclease RecJ, partial [Eubacteriales bacterium]|nr:single-stranded-DNA-specific exonuclease RecJ [Eubacteriales bacterium]